MSDTFKRYIKFMWPWMVMGIIPWAAIGWTLPLKLIGLVIQIFGFIMIVHKGTGEWARAEQALRDEEWAKLRTKKEDPDSWTDNSDSHV